MKLSLTAGMCLLLILLVCLPASAAAGQTGAVSVISSPQPADVYVSGVYVGQTNNAFVNIPEGSHTVRVVKAGYHEYVAENVYVPGGPSANTVPMSANLQKSETLAGLVVDSTPEGASVYVDDVYYGTTHYGGLQIADLSSGLHTIRLEMDGYKPYTVTDYNTPSGYATYLTNVRLIPLATATPTPTVTGSTTTAAITLDSTPSGATVSLNNELRGYTPLTIPELVPGSYSVLVSRDGYMAWQTTLTVAAGDVVTQTAVLNPVPAAPVAPTKAAAGIVPVFAGVLIAAGCLITFRH
ncbi:PEGA domain-containing protein [Methanocorpusculum vombati]|uniref:PEGA domain-containing protein n=1 Tax=Methanocorpusculum vombati TaxID=3002864 RepID=A0ABT4IJ93_9EURY|nr:PEGA domain-containing protein [Methanocorpusculum vombati]MCZ9319909.1 PEGA domain-containing protein [Methanocorpusculum sp.]MCZ0861816.1 PEGA domain-containing protein [Methanocorpusculum vombati]MDE2521214.1 PEGA domain-containing protein [Methanocorpusculum sp.]MDE2534951.1 PEGA domain-containing protein [Methanocorpusculum sp.]MDE2545499.1 PEGA domain-containing protein [Methanocorpusculum sp.]